MNNPVSPVPASPAIRRWSLLLFLGWTAFLFAGSWYPFRWNERSWDDAFRAWRSISFGSDHATTDVALNLLVGIPLGFLGYLACSGGRRKRPFGWIAAVAVLIVSISISTAVEIGQHRVAHRVASSIDTLAQTVGAFGGVLLAASSGSWLVWRLTLVLGSRSGPGRHRHDAALELYVAGYTGWMLMPFMPALSPSELAGKWRSGAIRLAPWGNWLSDPWTAGYTALVCLVTAFPVGWWMSRQRFWTLNRKPLTQRVAAAICLVAGLECVQVFIETRTFAVDDVIWSVIGAMLGATLSAADHRKSALVSQNPSLWSGLAVSYVLIYLIAAWVPFDLVGSSAESVAKLREAFAEPAGWKEIGGNDYVLGTNLFRTGLWSLLLGGIVTRCWTVNWPRCRAVAGSLSAALVSLTAVIAEFGQFAIQSSTPSLLAVFVRVIGAIGGVIFVVRLFR